jgi:mono/diheme cytochrome c family protein
MALQLSTIVRNSLLDAIEVAVGPNPILKIWAGTGSPQSMPTDCAAANVGTLLAQIDLASNWAAAASGGTKLFSNLPLSDAAANASGIANYYRIYASDGTTCHLQGTVTATGGGGDIVFNTTSVTIGEVVNFSTLSMTGPGA